MMPIHKIPVTVLVVTKNEEARLARCLAALTPFAEVIVVDSDSTDNTCGVACAMDVAYKRFSWNGSYPKKRQWCLDHLSFRYDFVFMVDADEIVTPDLCAEIETLFAHNKKPDAAGYFVRGRYARGGDVLCYGLQNNKLTLFNRYKMKYPEVDDLDIEGMGEIEGHYQPVLNSAHKDATIRQLRAPLIHEAYDHGGCAWEERHKRYAHWVACMDARDSWPADPLPARRHMKSLFQALPFVLQPAAAFIHSYILKAGVLDGKQGFLFARDRAFYYRMIIQEKRSVLDSDDAGSSGCAQD